jgi:hypothetical protein
LNESSAGLGLGCFQEGAKLEKNDKDNPLTKQVL